MIVNGCTNCKKKQKKLKFKGDINNYLNSLKICSKCEIKLRLWKAGSLRIHLMKRRLTWLLVFIHCLLLLTSLENRLAGGDREFDCFPYLFARIWGVGDIEADLFKIGDDPKQCTFSEVLEKTPVLGSTANLDEERSTFLEHLTGIEKSDCCLLHDDKSTFLDRRVLTGVAADVSERRVLVVVSIDRTGFFIELILPKIVLQS